MAARLLEVANLHTHFDTYKGVARVINGLDISLDCGEMLGLIGETGSGKSVAGRSIINLVEYPGRVVSGEVLLAGESLLGKTDAEMQSIRGKDIALIVGDPRMHLDPLMNIGDHIANVYLAHHEGASRREALRRAVEMLVAVGFNDAERRAKSYAHQLSGGMAQRVLIALALVNSPMLVLSDDSTSNLDVTIQRQVLDMMQNLIKENNSSVMIITHDLGIVAHYCQRVALMYAGQIVEQAPVSAFFSHALHPYSISVLNSIRSRRGKKRMESSLTGSAPNPLALPPGCALHPRCDLAQASCRERVPEMTKVGLDHLVRCPVAVSRGADASSH